MPAHDLPPTRHRILSLSAAIAGLGHAFGHEINLQVEVASAIIVAAAATWLSLVGLGFSGVEWAVLVLTVVLVLALELVNTAFEHLADLSRPRLDPLVRVAKDVSAAAVLLASLGAVVVGVVLFAPRIAQVLH
ncbi:MAG: diacylglycerol kinase [Candidatus Andersenbacteria bacterium]